MAKRRKRRARRLTGTPESELRAALKRLEESSTKLQRKNSRSHLWRVLGWIKSEAGTKYPLLDNEGEPTDPVKRRARCPLCDIPTMTSFAALAKHLTMKHGLLDGQVPAKFYSGQAYTKCWCGKSFKLRPSRAGGVATTFKDFGRHLARLKDLPMHMKSAVAKQILKEF